MQITRVWHSVVGTFIVAPTTNMLVIKVVCSFSSDLHLVTTLAQRLAFLQVHWHQTHKNSILIVSCYIKPVLITTSLCEASKLFRQIPASFSFTFVFCTENIFGSHQDWNLDRQSTRRGRWPLDHHYGPWASKPFKNIFVWWVLVCMQCGTGFYSKMLVCVWWRILMSLNQPLQKYAGHFSECQNTKKWNSRF